MNSKTTWRLFLLAIGLFAFIYFIETREPAPAAAARARVFAGTSESAVNVVEVNISNLTIRAERTNDIWRLTTPQYPAQDTPIETYLTALLGAEKQAVISSSEVAGKLKDFGLEPPFAKLSITTRSNRFHLHLGSRPPLSDQVYAQLAGSGEVMVLDGAFLKSVPLSADDWRSPMLIHLGGRTFDRLQIRSGPRQMEFERDPTNRIWRITKPMPARANHAKIEQMLRALLNARVNRFVTDSPAADLERFGLQTPDVELYFAMDTNRIAGLEFGASPTNDPASIFVRRLTTTNIVAAPRELLAELKAEPKEFHDPRLVSVDPREITRVQVNGTNGFTVTKATNDTWQITAPSPMAADSEFVRAFLNSIAQMEIVDSAKDVPTDADLKQFGLTAPRYSLGLFGGPTNALLMQIDFGERKTEDTMYVRRSDETPVYVTPSLMELALPREWWQVRARQIFDFAPSNVFSISFSKNGATLATLPRQPGGWSRDEIENAKIEEALFRLGKLEARSWSGRGEARLAQLGVSNAGFAIELGLNRGGATNTVKINLGKAAPRGNYYGATPIPGDSEPTAFVFPGDIYKLLQETFGFRE